MYHRLFSVSFVTFGLILVVGLAACAPAAEPSPTPSPLPPSSTPPPAPTDTASPASPTPTASPSPTPSPTPTAGPAPDETVALFSAGSPEGPGLHALAADGTATDLERIVYGRGAISDDGEWVATANSQLPTDAVVAFNLESGTTYTVPVTADFDPYGMAFDSSASRLAFLELGAPSAEGVPWAIVVVDMADGSTVRFETTTGPDNTRLPGSPIGWAGDELLIDTFIPYSDALSTGLCAVTLPPDATSGPLDELDRREVLAEER